MGNLSFATLAILPRWNVGELLWGRVPLTLSKEGFVMWVAKIKNHILTAGPKVL